MTEYVKKATSKDVARLANVSQPTVSYVLNNTPGKSISEETRNKVLQAARELNYSVNVSARRLKTQKSNCISVRLVNNLSHIRFSKMAEGSRTYLESRGYSLLLCSDQKGNNQYPDYLNAYFNSMADGILFISVDGTVPEEVVRIVNEHNIPFSVIDSVEENYSYSNVHYDYMQTTFRQADILINEGFRKIIYLRGEVDNQKEDLRERGVKAAAYSVPGVELEIRRIPSVRNATVDLVKDHLEEQKVSMDYGTIRNIIRETDPDTCFVCCYSPFPEKIKELLYMEYLANPSEKTANWYKRTVSYHFDHYEAGLEGTRSLMDQIRGIKDQRIFSLVPVFDPLSADELTLLRTEY